jgi:hypothetical protein
MNELRLPYEWRPRPYQEPLWNYLSHGGKRAVTCWHRRSGKDETYLHHTACAAHERVGNYWYMLPEYAQARKSMWDAVNPNTGRRRIDDAFPQALRRTTRENEMNIVFGNGSTFQLVGSDNFNALVGSPPVGLVFSEAALSNPSAWAYLQPILEENGGWVGFNSTPRGKNHFKNLFDYACSSDRWFSQLLTNDDTGVFTEDQLQEILRSLQAVHGEAFGRSLWLQEYFCSFDAAIPGSIWGDCVDKLQQDGQISAVPLELEYPVYTGWDLGRTDDTVIWFYQVCLGRVRVIDYHASNMKDVDFYAQLLHDKREERGFTYGTHWLPHDARPRTLAAGGKSILQQFDDLNAKMGGKLGKFAICPRLDREEGIQAARATFKVSWFDDTRCEDGIEALRHYHRTWDEEKQVFSTEPFHDWASHPADAWRTVALTWKTAKVTPEGRDTTIADLLRGSIGSLTFGAMKKQHFARARERRQNA